MRVKSKPVSSLNQQNFSCSSSRTRKKHKRLDAICENAYKENHVGASEGNAGVRDGDGDEKDDSDLRRSQRVRRAPVILDASPPPPKRRRKLDKTEKGSSWNKGELSSVCAEVNNDEENSEDVETPGVWKSRLRLRDRRRHSFRSGEKVESPAGKRRLFRYIIEEEKEELEVDWKKTDVQNSENDEDMGEVARGTSVPTKKKTKGKVKAAASSGNGENMDKLTIGSSALGKSKRVGKPKATVSLEDQETNVTLDLGIEVQRVGKAKAMIALEDQEKEGVLDSVGEVESSGNEIKGHGDDLPAQTESCMGNVVGNIEATEIALAGEKEGNMSDAACNEVRCSGDDILAVSEQAEEIMEIEEDGTCVIGGTYDERVDEESVDKLEADSQDRENDDKLVRQSEKPIESEQVKDLDAKTHGSMDTIGFSCIKGGRRCGLCGGGTDGKPPKKLATETGESENEAYDCSSPLEEPNYDIWDGFSDEPDWLGRLLGPINDRNGIAGIWVHQHCAVWSPEVYFAGLGCLKNVRAALYRGRALKCTRCGRPGATIGCRVDRCPKTYHLPCARANGCTFDHRKFLIACTDHRHFFQPHGIKNSNWLKRMRAKKMKLAFRKFSNDASRKDIEAEEKWLENCGEDEEFLKRESRRLHRDLLRISPVYIGGANAEDRNMFEGWESVAGLQDVIKCMKEVVILPLLYPEFFDKLGLTPPRGVLLHGYPGTGKTLVVRSLIGACARGDKRIAYFARKGADCLGKYVGDAERQLRLLFQVAEKCQPSIIFFDEIDGLAPRRTRQQDQTHSSVVSTLLALLDGLKSRGSVVVIGATNRPDAVDPALRRPGRFDREIYFPLPSLEDRAEILSLHTKKWPKPVSGSLLKFIAEKTPGFAGADLQALCTQAAIIALKRSFPLQEILSAAGMNSSGGERVPLPSLIVDERDWLEALSCSPPPCSRREAGIAANDIVSSPLPTHLIPCLVKPLSLLLVSLHLNENLCLPPALSKAASAVKSIIFSAMGLRKLANEHWQTHVQELLQDSEIAEDIERGLSSFSLLVGDAFSYDYNHNSLQSESSLTFNRETRSFTSRNTSFALRKDSGYRVLLSGSPGSGQRHLASCLLHCYIGNVEVQKIDLATVSQEGHGDAVLGITQILTKCANAGSSVVFMPRVDLWAIETLCTVTNEEGKLEKMEVEPHVQQSRSDEMAGLKDLEHRASQAWNAFVEQAESICVNTSLVVLATSDIAFSALPGRIRQYFSSDVQKRCRSAHWEHALPRFCINVDADVNIDMVIRQSAVRLSSSLVQQLVQLIHRKSHPRTATQYGNSESTTEHISNGALAGKGETDCAEQHSDDSSPKTSQVANKRNLKGKTSLMLAISSFGYQILRYPHFAELCWVTSKLKGGPVADTSGPWKVWPFNSCIIGPYDTTEGTAIDCSPSNVKNEEKFGLVRGLAAVGLSAYRGIYVSAREVSFEIRQVLEILVGQINVKIQAGKDKLNYFRILSQVSYLEDLVYSWAYSLQSLESDAQVTITKATPGDSAVSPPNQNTNDDMLQTEEVQLHMPEVFVETEEGLERSTEAQVENVGNADLNKVNGNCMRPDSLDEGCSVLGSPLDDHRLCPVTGHKFVGDIFNGSNGTNASSPTLEPTGRDPARALQYMGILSGHEPCSLGALKDTEINSTDVDTNSSEDCPARYGTCGATASGTTCLYRCCSKCLSALDDLLRKLLVREWDLNRNQWTVEDVHDAVASLSVDLFSSLRNSCFTDNSSNMLGETHIKPSGTKGCGCTSSVSGMNAAEECTCHSVSAHEMAEEGNRSGKGCPSGSHVEFIIRNGVLEMGNPDQKVDFHCKFETLCLCCLSKLGVFTKVGTTSDTV